MSFLATASSNINPWLRILTALEKKINHQSFDTWFKPTRFSRIEGRVLVVTVPTREFEHIGERYNDHILEAVDQLGLEVDEVSFEALQEEAPPPRVRQDGGFAPQPTRSSNPARNRYNSSAAPRRSSLASIGIRPRNSILVTPSTRLSSATEINLPALPPRLSPNVLRRPTTRCSSTAQSATARRT